MGEFSITAESIETGARTLFTASELIYGAMSTLSKDMGSLEGSAEAAGFSGIAECVQASQIWESDYIAVHRADIEDAAMSAAVSAASSEEVDNYVSSMFDQHTDTYFPEGRDSPVPVRPDPDPSSQMPRGSESVAV
jgi:hypothetical protein